MSSADHPDADPGESSGRNPRELLRIAEAAAEIGKWGVVRDTTRELLDVIDDRLDRDDDDYSHVVVITHRASGHVLKVVRTWGQADEWVADSTYSDKEVRTTRCGVMEDA